jgi:hypothetical protein
MFPPRPPRRDPRLVLASPELTEQAKILLDELGPAHAAEELGISRATLLGIVAGTPVMPGSLALLREAMRRRGEGSEGGSGASLLAELNRVGSRGF